MDKLNQPSHPASADSGNMATISRPDPANLVRDFGPLISSLAFQFFGKHETARDAAQEAWVAVLAALDSFQGKSELSSWVWTVSWRRMLQLKKSEKLYRLHQLESSYRVDEIPAPQSSNPELRYWAEETCRRCMTGVLFCLTSPQRLAFIFRYTAGLSFPEIAGILGTTAPNARQLFSRARRQLSEFMTRNCAFAKPDSPCRCGMDRSVKASGLEAAFHRLGSFGQAVEAYRIHPKLMPGPNYWEDFIKIPEVQ